MIEYLYDIAAYGGPLLLVAATMILMVESGYLFGLVLPGSSTVLVAGVMVGIGHLPTILTVSALTLGTTAGSQISFIRRRRSGNTLGVSQFAIGARAWAQSQFERGPVVGSALAQFFGGARTCAPWLAAASQMSYRSFAVTNACAALVWVTVLVLTGRFAGQDPLAAVPLLVCAALLLLSVFCVRRVSIFAKVGQSAIWDRHTVGRKRRGLDPGR